MVEVRAHVKGDTTMRRTPLLSIPLVLAIAATALAGEGPRHREHRGDFLKGGPGFLAKMLLGDATPEEKDALKAIGKEFLEGARPYLPALRAEGMALHEKIRAALSGEEQARVKGVVAKVRGLSVPEKIALAQGFFGPLNTPEMRADVKLFLKGGSDERGPAGERIARAAAARFVGEMAKRAEVGDAAASAVLQAFGEFLDSTRPGRTAVRDLAQEKLAAAWAVLTPEQKGRVKGALQFLRGWLEATVPAEPAAGSE
jgi:Spy/CpxP family protein refolding chaperone